MISAPPFPLIGWIFNDFHLYTRHLRCFFLESQVSGLRSSLRSHLCVPSSSGERLTSTPPRHPLPVSWDVRLPVLFRCSGHWWQHGLRVHHAKGRLCSHSVLLLDVLWIPEKSIPSQNSGYVFLASPNCNTLEARHYSRLFTWDPPWDLGSCPPNRRSLQTAGDCSQSTVIVPPASRTESKPGLSHPPWSRFQ